jgi:hypothetical protein
MDTEPATPSSPSAPISERGLARLVLVAFVVTFICARLMTFLIMSKRIPDLYLRLAGTHVHHLNYGIFLLGIVGAYLLFTRVGPREKIVAGVTYGIGLALTFDEFGMWLHLGGGYWQRASFDAIVVLASVLSLIAYAPPVRNWRPRDLTTAVLLIGATAMFFLMLRESFRFAARIEPRLMRLEETIR